MGHSKKESICIAFSSIEELKMVMDIIIRDKDSYIE